jgi:hypothetical protein
MMRVIFLLLACVIFTGCSSLPGQGSSPVAANVALVALQALSYHQQYGCVPAGVVPPAATLCAPITSTDPATQQQQIIACGLALAAQNVIKQCPTTSPTPAPAPPIVPVPVPAPTPKTQFIEPTMQPPSLLRTSWREDHGQ